MVIGTLTKDWANLWLRVEHTIENTNGAVCHLRSFPLAQRVRDDIRTFSRLLSHFLFVKINSDNSITRCVQESLPWAEFPTAGDG
jgi:hypothetical protein